MFMRRSWLTGRCLAGAGLLLAASAASAQTTEPGAPPPGDSITIGIGGAIAPTYEGSNDYSLVPAALVRGQLAGFNFFSRATALYVDLAREPAGAKTDLLIGPMGNLRFDRSNAIEDVAVRRLGKLDTAIELGGFVGLGRSGLLNPYDYGSVRLDVVTDVTGTHDGTIVTPNIEYGTPLNRKTYAGLNLSADHASGSFADTYYSVDAAGSARSGLRQYDAGSGFKNARITLLGVRMLTGDLTTTGLGFFVVGSYSRMFGDFKNSPLVRDVGSKNQYFAAAGLSYSF